MLLRHARNARGVGDRRAERELSEVASSAAVRWRSFKARTRHGAIGDPRAARADKGERLLDAAGDAVAELIGNQEFWSMPA